MDVPEIDVAELAARQAEGAALIDVRRPEEFADARVPGAQLIPLGEVVERIDEVPTDGTVYVICATGAAQRQGRGALPIPGHRRRERRRRHPGLDRRGAAHRSGGERGRGRLSVPTGTGTHAWIDTDRGFGEVLDELAAAEAYGLDTEFHRERTYHARLALLQLSWPGGTAVVDPTVVDVAPLAAVLDGDGVCLMHAASQDLEILARVCGTLPSRLFDTQVAAGFVGYSSVGLAGPGAGRARAEAARRPTGSPTGWPARSPRGPSPTRSPTCCTSTSSATAWSPSSRREAGCPGRSTSARCTASGPPAGRCPTGRGGGSRRPDRCGAAPPRWRRCSPPGGSGGPPRSTGPVRFLLPDLALVAMAQRPPASEDDLRRVRGLDDGKKRGGAARELLAVVAEGLALPLDDVQLPQSEGVDRSRRAAASLVSAWAAQRARDLDIDAAILATRADIESLLMGDGGRLATGWRHDVVGEPIRALAAGEASLAVDGQGRLRLETRSGVPLVE